MSNSPGLRRTPLPKARRRKCKAPSCRQWFQPISTFSKACSTPCALEIIRAEDAKQFRKETRQMREKLKTRRDYLKEAQQAFNAWVRERDHGRPCISCGRTPNDNDLMTGSRWDAGHYRSTGANPELRFEPLNCHRQCVQCNRDLSGNVANFRIGLRDRIGDEALEWLDGPHEPKKYTAAQLQAIRDHYRREARRLKRKREKS